MAATGHTDGQAARGETFEAVLARRVARRSFVKGALAAVPLLVAGPSLLGWGRTQAALDGLTFTPISPGTEDTVVTADGYAADVLLRWGDPLFPDSPTFDVAAQSAAAQARQVGYNADFVGFFPLPRFRARSASRGLLTVNHEYTNPELMFPGYEAGSPGRDQVDVELAAHGLSVVEITRVPGGGWRAVTASPLNRRITGETEMALTGPAAGHGWLRVSDDPTGTRVRGMLNNCGGGKTPWGTLLTCEENFNQYFANSDGLPSADPRQAIHLRYGLPGGASERRWEDFHDRFDVSREPNEPFRFGWVVEIDPYDPAWVPRKRTALGRLKHEAATAVLAADGRVVVYTGDDERFDYVYKFVSGGRVSSRREANFGLLDHGTLHVARFDDDGTGTWIPLVAGVGALAAWSQAEVLINTRGAADAVGATRMDRPEDIETNPVNGKVYCVMTNNTRRGASGQPDVDAANPRAGNRFGHVIELTEAGEDHGAGTFTWEIFMLCGDPRDPAHATYFAGFDPGQVSAIANPDNIAFDRRGNLWIATDGQPGSLGAHDGIFAVPTEGEQRGFVRQLLSGPRGCEVASLDFTPDNDTLFCSIQHPGEGGSLAAPISTGPDGTQPPRPGVVAVTRTQPGAPIVGA